MPSVFHASYAPPARHLANFASDVDLGFNIWGAITGAIGIMTLLPAARIDMQLPSRKIVALKTFMNETQTLFKNDLEEGPAHSRGRTVAVLYSHFDRRIDDVAYDVDMLQDWGALVKGWWDGVTEVIQSLHADVNRLANKLVVRRSVCIREHMILITIRFSKAVLETDSGWQLKATPKGWQERRMSIMALAQPGSDPEILKDYADVALPDNSEVYLARVHSPIPHRGCQLKWPHMPPDPRDLTIVVNPLPQGLSKAGHHKRPKHPVFAASSANTAHFAGAFYTDFHRSHTTCPFLMH
ncbi:hypothetical protein BC628DRAFT_1420048 [Trametes gibbosa]|nr:hypothetical protein BC628DRAFT_1420048 [Trametes gibbosa]